jgi:hypothetical protein
MRHVIQRRTSMSLPLKNLIQAMSLSIRLYKDLASSALTLIPGRAQH